MSIKVEGDARAKFAQAAAVLPGAARRGVAASARAVKVEIQRGAPARLRGVGKRGAALGVTYSVRGNSSDDATALVRATGPWQLIENNTKAHLILPKKAGSRGARSRIGTGLFVLAPGNRGGGRGAVLTPQGPRAYARSRGTVGKHPWKHGVERARPLAVRAFEGQVIEEVRKKFT